MITVYKRAMPSLATDVKELRHSLLLEENDFHRCSLLLWL